VAYPCRVGADDEVPPDKAADDDEGGGGELLGADVGALLGGGELLPLLLLGGELGAELGGELLAGRVPLALVPPCDPELVPLAGPVPPTELDGISDG
jgi:hypothetical protein